MTWYMFNFARLSLGLVARCFLSRRRGCKCMGRKPGAPMKLLLIGGVVGLVIGVVLTVFYFSLGRRIRA